MSQILIVCAKPINNTFRLDYDKFNTELNAYVNTGWTAINLAFHPGSHGPCVLIYKDR